MQKCTRYGAANYHKNTIVSFLTLIGAIGLSSPSDLKPHLIMRRISENCAKPFDEIYDLLKPGELLGNQIPVDFKKYWDLACADRF